MSANAERPVPRYKLVEWLAGFRGTLLESAAAVIIEREAARLARWLEALPEHDAHIKAWRNRQLVQLHPRSSIQHLMNAAPGGLIPYQNAHQLSALQQAMMTQSQMAQNPYANSLSGNSRLYYLLGYR